MDKLSISVIYKIIVIDRHRIEPSVAIFCDDELTDNDWIKYGMHICSIRPPLWYSGQSSWYRSGGPGSIPGTTRKK
jgi:hypothetical protein